MKTQFDKEFTWGFLLSEQELRRLFQTCQSQIGKLGLPTVRTLVEARLADGSVVESNGLEEVLALENAGSKKVKAIKLSVDDGKEEQEFRIVVEYLDASRTRGWDSITLSVKGQERDWVFLAGSEIEERVKKTKIVALEYLINHRLTLPVMMMASMVCVLFFVARAQGHNHTALDSVERRYLSGELKEPIAALIAVFRAKDIDARAEMPWFAVAPMLGGFLGLFLPSLAVAKLVPSYNFYWGDYVSVFDRRRSIMKIVGGSIMLATIVGVLSNFVWSRLG